METTIANPSPIQVIGRASECMRRLMEAGLPFEALQMPIDDPEMRKRLVRFWTSGGFEVTSSEKRAREIMGKNFFGIEEAIRHFAVNPTRLELALLADIPFTEATLEACKDRYVLVAVLPMSILDVCSEVTGRRLLYNQDWYNREPFAKDRDIVRWALVRKTPVPNSTHKTWQEQQALLAENEETPSARVMVYTIIGHYLATGERLFERLYVRCSNVDSRGLQVGVGGFDSDGLCVSDRWGGHRGGGIGVAAARKFD